MLSYAVMLTKTRAPKPGSRFIADRVQEHAEGWNSHQDNPYAYPNAEHYLLIPAMLRKLLGVQSILVPALTGRASTDSLLTAPAPPFVNQSQSTRRCGGSVCATSMCGFRAYLLRLCWKAHLNTQLSLTSVHRITGDSSKATSPRILRIAGYRWL